MGVNTERKRRIGRIYPVCKLIKHQERDIKAGRSGVPWPRGVKDISKPYQGPLSLESFQYPWPAIPFSYRARRYKYFLPFQALPSSITVHDPWNTLAVDSRNALGTAENHIKGDLHHGAWMHQKDNVHQYHLKVFNPAAQKIRDRAETVDPAQASAMQNAVNTLSSSESGEVLIARWRAIPHNHSDCGPLAAPHFFRGEKDVTPRPLSGFLVCPTLEEAFSTASILPPVFLAHSPPPDDTDDPTNVDGIGPPGEQSHVYFAPNHLSGTGHHSKAYTVEWELPQFSVFPMFKYARTFEGKRSPYGFCCQCLTDDVQKQLKEESDDEYWKKQGKELEEVKGTLRKFEGDAPVEPLKPSSCRLDGRAGVTYIGDPLTPSEDIPTEVAVDPKDYPRIWNYEYEGPIRIIHTRVRHHHSLRGTCSHFSLPNWPRSPPKHNAPLTTKVRVMAKLSRAGDQHLRNEGKIYERFTFAKQGAGGGPDLWQHWGGYGEDDSKEEVTGSQAKAKEPKADEKAGDVGHSREADKESKDQPSLGANNESKDKFTPTPRPKDKYPEELMKPKEDIQVDAIVPRYYGYYVHDEKCPCTPPSTYKGYFSDILLTENCGESLDKIHLTSAERHRIMELYDRFHELGWTHGSPFTRNVVWQYGPLNRPMHRRKTERHNRNLSFRLIDFGRSMYHSGFDYLSAHDGPGKPGYAERHRWIYECREEDRVIRHEYSNMAGYY